MSVASLTHDDIDRILKYLDLPSSDQLPLSPIPFLKKYLPILPASLLTPFNQITSPRQRTVIRQVKARRMIYSSQSPLPDELIAERARLRWPLLWERMGGSSLPPPTAEVQDEERWVETSFLPGRSNTQHVKKLGGLLRGFEEEREMEGVVAARRMERRLDDQGEEFDEESDEEEDGPNGAHNVNGNDSMRPETVGQTTVAEQDEMRRAFEKKIMELFVDGLDTIDYNEIDFTEPPGGDAIAERDQEEAYFDDQEPSGLSKGHHPNGNTDSRSTTPPAGDKTQQNGQGEYDY